MSLAEMILEIVAGLLRLFSRDLTVRESQRQKFLEWINRSNENADASAMVDKNFDQAFEDLKNEDQSKSREK